MNHQQNNKSNTRFIWRSGVFGMLGAVGLLLAVENLSAQTTNAFDSAADPAYSGGFSSEQNGGFGFGAWTVTIGGSGGAFISGTGPSWNLWNNDINASSVAVRPFASALVPGQSLSFKTRFQSLVNNDDTNAVVLQDASGNTLFSYYHTGFEANSANGTYTDAATSSGVAVGFDYNYMQFNSFTFTLNSSTTYTFADNTTGRSFTGTLSGAPITQVSFVRGNGSTGVGGNGQDFQITDLSVVSSAPPTFVTQTPAPGSYSASGTNISLAIIAGGTPINTGAISFKVDGNAVTPSISTVSATTTISYTPASSLSPGVTHTVQVVAADSNNSLFTNTWSFRTGSPALPVTLPGPIVTGTDGSGVVIFSNPGEGWLGTNYDANSSQTIFARFSMTFHDMAGESGGGGAYGGLEFYQDNAERLIIGNNWNSTMWSLEGSGPGNLDLLPNTEIVLNEWHTIVVRIDYAQGANAAAKIWLDPSFGMTEAAQPNPPLVIDSVAATFNNIRLRCGNGSAYAEFTNIVIAATSADVGILPPVTPTFQHLIPGPGAAFASPKSPISVEIVEGDTAISKNNIVMNVDGDLVTPTVTVSGKTNFVSYQPSVPFTAGSSHTVTVSLTDKQGTPYSTTWSFTVDTYSTLPITFDQDFDVQGQDQTLLTSQNGCLDGKYGTTSSNTLYVSVRMAFTQMAVENGGAGVFGGLEFYLGNTERFLIGNNWTSGNWSLDVWGTLISPDCLPPTQLVTDEYHTMVARIDFVPGSNANVKVWLDPDLGKREGSQTYAPTTFSSAITFDNIKLRAGNDNTSLRFSGITLSGTTLFAAEPPSPPVLSISKQGGNVQVSWTGTGTLQQVSAINGTWADSADQANPQTVATTNSALFFRIKQ